MRHGLVDNLVRLLGIPHVNQLTEPPGADRFFDRRDQSWKRCQIGDRRSSETHRFGKTVMDRIDVIFLAEFGFLGVDRTDPTGERQLPADLSAEHRVIQVAMRVDQTREQNPFAEIEHLAVVLPPDFIESAHRCDLVLAHSHRTVFNRVAHHWHNRPRTNDHRFS